MFLITNKNIIAFFDCLLDKYLSSDYCIKIFIFTFVKLIINRSFEIHRFINRGTYKLQSKVNLIFLKQTLKAKNATIHLLG